MNKNYSVFLVSLSLILVLKIKDVRANNMDSGIYG